MTNPTIIDKESTTSKEIQHDQNLMNASNQAGKIWDAINELKLFALTFDLMELDRYHTTLGEHEEFYNQLACNLDDMARGAC